MADDSVSQLLVTLRKHEWQQLTWMFLDERDQGEIIGCRREKAGGGFEVLWVNSPEWRRAWTRGEEVCASRSERTKKQTKSARSKGKVALGKWQEAAGRSWDLKCWVCLGPVSEWDGLDGVHFSHSAWSVFWRQRKTQRGDLWMEWMRTWT